MKFALLAITIKLTMTMTITKPCEYGDDIGDDNDHKDCSYTATGAADGAGAATDES